MATTSLRETLNSYEYKLKKSGVTEPLATYLADPRDEDALAAGFVALGDDGVSLVTKNGTLPLTGGGAVSAGTVVGLDEWVDDRVNTLVVAGSGVTKTYDDTANTLTLAVSATAANVSDFNEAVDDRVSSLLVPGTGIGLAYNDAGNALTVSTVSVDANTVSASRNLVAADFETVLDVTGAFTVTITNDTVLGISGSTKQQAFGIYAVSASLPSVVAGSGVTISNTAPTIVQYGTYVLQRKAANTWVWIKG